jgi:phosphoglucosamine mutase
MGELFGTDGVRGVANEGLTGELAYKLGRAGGFYLTSGVKKDRKPVMLIGKDTRVSGDMLESALVAGMTSVGIDVVKLGIIPTPGVSYLSSLLDVDGAVMISASHNPIADNGIKFFDGQGFKLTDQMEDDIERLILDNFASIPYPTGTDIGNLDRGEGLVEKYIDYLVSTIDVDFSGLRVGLDCANGAAYHVAPEVLKRLGAEVVEINNHPAGHKINLNCGSTHPEVIRDLVLREKTDLGIAHDGDADRVIMVDELGNIIDGDRIMAICALELLKNKKLRGETLVTTAYSNLGLKEVVEKNGGRIAITDNGDRYVLREMLDKGYNLGGEQSGHIIFLDFNRTGDGVLTAIQTIAIIRRSGKKISELAGEMEPWPQRLVNVFANNKDWESSEKIQEVIGYADERLGDEGRIFVRASGTEPVLRVMLEGRDEKLLKELEETIVTTIEEELN